MSQPVQACFYYLSEGDHVIVSLYGRAASPCLLSVCDAAYVLLCILSELIYMRHRAQYLAGIGISEAATTWQQLPMAKTFPLC